MSELLTPAVLVAGIMVLALNFYALLGGADFGGGVWDLLASGPRRERQRALVADAIGPIWEANHVWLILVVVLLFTCFPPAFERLSIVLHIPLTLMLIGIVLRGSAFTFRTYDSRRDAVQRRWGRIFAVASLATPVLLGICIGAVASGRVGIPTTFANAERCEEVARGAAFEDCLRTQESLRDRPEIREVFLDPWLSPFGFGVGLLTLALFAFLAAVYLTLEAPDEEVREDFRRRALWTAAAVFVAAFGVLALAMVDAPLMQAGLLASPWALPLHGATAAAAIGAIWALWARRFVLARIAAAAQVSLILWGWALAQYPYVVPPALSIQDAAAPERTLRLVLWALLAGAAVLFPSLRYLFRIFKGSGPAFSRVERTSGGSS